jgi:hypothetical protein
MVATGSAEGEALAGGHATPKQNESKGRQGAHGGSTNQQPNAFRARQISALW